MTAFRPVICVVLGALVGCGGGKKGDGSNGPDASAPAGALTIKVVDGSNDQPLAGVRVFAGAEPKGVTDEGGAFVLAGMSVTERVVLRFEAPGYADGVVPAALSEGDAEALEVMLVPGAVGTIMMAAGGTVSDGAGGEARFGPSSLVRADGQPATGEVSVTLVALDPTRDDGLTMFPGDFAAARMDGTTEVLDTFVPINVTAREGDTQLNLGPGQKAAVRIPVPPNRIDEAPDQMPMWSLDPTTGSWKEEGILGTLTPDAASPSGFSYVAEIPHLSWWNMDMSYRVACLKGCVKTTSNQPVSGAEINAAGPTLQRESTRTNTNGCFAVNMPLSSPVTIVAKRNNRSVSRSARTGGTPANTRQSPSWAGCTDIGTLTLDDCKAGDRRCNGRTPEVCESSLGRWIKQPVCANGCFAGRCTECVPGSDKRSCDGNRVRVCGDDGRYTSGAACPNGCFNGACLPCTPGARTCHGTSPMVCNGRGQWQAEGAACASTGRCSVRPLIDGSRCYGGACAPGTATTCQGKTPVSCDAVGRLVIGKPCATACIAGACAQCSPGQRGCGKEGEPLACGDDGTWTPMGDKCPFACDQGACAGECQPGSKRCLENLRQSCNAQGRWVTEQTCAFRCGESAGATACAGECRPGQKACQGNLPRLCSERGEVDQPRDLPGGLPRGRVSGLRQGRGPLRRQRPLHPGRAVQLGRGRAVPGRLLAGPLRAGPCFPMGSRKCEGNQVLLCNASGQYEPSESCAASCSAGTCTTCQPGARVCSERTLRTCSPWGEWDAGQICPEGCEGGICRGGSAPDGGVDGCGSLTLMDAPPVILRANPGARPATTGGESPPGLYQLESATVYGTATAPATPPVSAVLSLAGGRFEFVMRVGDVEQRGAGEYISKGVVVGYTQTCPQPAAGDYGYSVDDSGTLTMHDWPVPGGVYVFRRRTGTGPVPMLPDAGAGVADGGRPPGCTSSETRCENADTLLVCGDSEPKRVPCPYGCAESRCLPGPTPPPDAGAMAPPARPQHRRRAAGRAQAGGIDAAQSRGRRAEQWCLRPQRGPLVRRDPGAARAASHAGPPPLRRELRGGLERRGPGRAARERGLHRHRHHARDPADVPGARGAAQARIHHPRGPAPHLRSRRPHRVGLPPSPAELSMSRGRRTPPRRLRRRASDCPRLNRRCSGVL